MKNKNGSFVVIFKNSKRDKVFLIYRSDQPFWNLPGGGIEVKEKPEEAAIRETLEETGFKINLLRKVGKYKHMDIKTGGVWNITYLFEATFISGKFVPEFQGCKGMWFPIDNLPSDIKQISLTRIKDVLTHHKKDPFIKVFKPS